MQIESLETFTSTQRKGRPAPVSFVRVKTDTGEEGIGQISPYNADIAAKVFHRQVAPHALGANPLAVESLVDDIIDAEYKFPWSYLCRAVTGLDTALWDLKAKREGVSVAELIGGGPTTLKPYGSSMSREITPEEEAERLARLKEKHGYEAFKIRVGSKMGHNEDAWPGRTEELIPTVREAIGDDTNLFVDANSCYTPEKAIEVGQLLEEYNVIHYEEPCPYPELEWTAEVRTALDDTVVQVAGGEQDNDLAQWRRMIDMHAVDIVQPDICYVGGLSRALRVADMANDAGLPVVPHSANHSLVTVFTMHMLTALENAGPYFEFSIEDQWAEGMLEPALTVEDGEIEVPDRPGWGFSINPEWLAASTYERSALD
nr:MULTISPECIES: mandelate racemase/muconate lactonizing enzyme family protein [unclassified Haladaptatus]